MKLKIKSEWSYFVIGILVILLIASMYLTNAKNSEIESLNSQIMDLQVEVDSYLGYFQSQSDDPSNILYQLCLRDTRCKEDYSTNIRKAYLEQLGIADAHFDRRDARFFTDTLPDFGGKLNDFIYSNCPGFKETTLGRTYSIYYYEHTNSTIGIIMNDDFVTLRCSWAYIPEEDQYYLLG